jgi:alpha-galactosidase
MSLGAMPLAAASALKPTPDEMEEARRFVAAKFVASQLPAPREDLFSADPPFSFAYNGKPSSGFLGTWKFDRKTNKIDTHRTNHTITYSDPAGGLSVRCEAVEYDDFPTVEWTLYFRNTGAADTPIIENIQSLDVRWQRGTGEFLLHHNIGSPADGTDYTPLESVLAANSTKRLAAAGGRSTNANMSYFNLERNRDEGLIVVVGWPGQWAADFIRDKDRGLRIKAGQELTHFKLLPGEEVRTPLSVLQLEMC